MRNKIILILGLLLFIHLYLLFNLQFTAWPEMFSFPYLVNNGFKLYSDFVHPYPPLLTLILAQIYKIFGYDVMVLRLATYILVVLSDVIVFQLIYKNSKSIVISSVSMLFYVLTQSFLDGNMLWFDTALVLPLLLAIYFQGIGKYKAMCVVLFIAFLIKQTAALYIFAFLINVFWKADAFKNSIKTFFLLGVIFIAVLYLNNNLQDFLLWNGWYPLKYWSSFPGYVQFNLTKGDVLSILFVSLPVFVAFLRKKYFLTCLYVVSLIAIYPRFSFFHMQAAIAISAVALGTLLKNKKEAFITILLITVMFGYFIRVNVFKRNSVRFYEQGDISFINKMSLIIKPGSSVFLIGLSSNIYSETMSLPPKPWLDNYGWYYEIQGVQENVINNFKSNPPQYIAIKEPIPGNWYDLGTYMPSTLVSWVTSNYEKVQNIDDGVLLYKFKK